MLVMDLPQNAYSSHSPGVVGKIHHVSTRVISGFLRNQNSLDTRIWRTYHFANTAPPPGRAPSMDVAMASPRI